MSGFLARLVARAQGRVAVAHPLVPPRFAPGLTRREVREPESPEPIERTIVDEAPVAAPVADGHRAPPGAPAPLARPAPVVDDATHAPAPRRTARPHPLDDARPAATEPGWLVPRNVSRPAVTTAAPSTPASTVALAIAAPTERAPQAAAPVRAAPEPAALPPAPARSADERPPAIHRPVPALATATVPPAPAPTRPTLVPPPPTAARAADRAARPASAPTVRLRAADPVPAPPPAPPVVQIHIGRVEVRAVVPAPATAPRVVPPRPPPAVSLDEHLRRRDRR